MNLPVERVRASLAGAALGAFLAAAVPLPLLVVNPWFLDASWLWVVGVGLPAAAGGGLLGVLLARLLRRLPARPSAWAVALAAALALPLVLGALWPRPTSTGRVRLLVVGIDGATFDVLDAFPQPLPNLTSLAEEGVRAPLYSMEPMFSPLLWTTMATGKLPEAHGIHGFHVQAGDCKVPQFWEILADRGIRVGIYKWLVSYPPLQIDAFQVPGWLAAGPETWPEDLSFIKEIELSRRLKRNKVAARRGTPALVWQGVLHGFRVSTLGRAVQVTLAERLGAPDAEATSRRGQLLKVWMDRDVAVWAAWRFDPEVLTFTTYATDALSHSGWRYWQPDLFPGTSPERLARGRGTLEAAYRQADTVLGELRTFAGPQARVVVVSDHGFQAFQGGAEAGRFFQPTTERIRALLAETAGPLDVSRLGHKIVCTFTGPEPVAQVAAAEALLADLRQASTGEPFYRWEPVEGDSRSLGLTLRMEDVTPERHATDRVGEEPISAFVSLTEPDSGVHHERGVFLAAGPGVSEGVRLERLDLIDVAPTLLSMVGLPAGQDMAGRVPAGLWVEAPTLPDAPPTWDGVVAGRKLLGGAEGVDEGALRALGYIE